MKYWILSFLFFLFGSLTHAQNITGYVIDEAEKKPLEGAFVYLDGTTLSTSTDANGYFELKTAGRINALLIVSLMGFERYLIEDPFSAAMPLRVILKEKLIGIEEVVINKQQVFSRKQLLKAFKDNFLGQTTNGSSCEIENEDDIILSYDTHGNVLLAHSEKPLVVVNKRLGYRIMFDLHDFKTQYNLRSVRNSDVSSSFFAGTTAFIDISENDKTGEKRKKAYLGSPMHFMRVLALNELDKEGFALYDNKFPVEASDYFELTDTLNVKKVKVTFPDVKAASGISFSASGGNKMSEPPKGKMKSTLRFKKLTVLYKGKYQSFLTFDKGIFYIDENGLFMPVTEVYFGGYMGIIKAGDMLPADYRPKP